MSNKAGQRLETVANSAIVIVALLFGIFLVQRFFFSSQPKPPAEIAKGTKISLPGIDWQKNRQTLLLVVQKSCKYCSESMPFYKTLADKALEKGTKLVVVSPNSIEESTQYLKENGVLIDDVMQQPLRSVNASATPTLMLMDEKGEVAKSWIGKLPPAKEEEVISQL